MGGLDASYQFLPFPFFNPEVELGRDDVLVMEEEAGWTAVRSANYAIGVPGRNPLALAVSRRWDVLSVTTDAAMARISYEIYSDGALTEALYLGEFPEIAGLDFKDLDLAKLAADGGIDVEGLRMNLEEPEKFTQALGCEFLGIYDVYECMPLEDVGEENLYVFVK